MLYCLRFSAFTYVAICIANLHAVRPEPAVASSHLDKQDGSLPWQVIVDVSDVGVGSVMTTDSGRMKAAMKHFHSLTGYRLSRESPQTIYQTVTMT